MVLAPGSLHGGGRVGAERLRRAGRRRRGASASAPGRGGLSRSECAGAGLRGSRQLGAALARVLLERGDLTGGTVRLVLGRPGGRSLRTTYSALAAHDRATLSPRRGDDGRVRAMLPSYRTLQLPRLRPPRAPARRSGCARTRSGFRMTKIHRSYVTRIAAAGGIELFLLASGASDGHVAFVRARVAARRRHVGRGARGEHAARQRSRRSREFASVDEVPTHGVSVGLDRLRRRTRAPARPARRRQADSDGAGARARRVDAAVAREHRARARRRRDLGRRGGAGVIARRARAAERHVRSWSPWISASRCARCCARARREDPDDGSRFKLAVARELAPYASGFLIEPGPRGGVAPFVASRADPRGRPARRRSPAASSRTRRSTRGRTRPGSRRLKLLVISRDDDQRTERIEMSRRFVELARRSRLAVGLEPVVRVPETSARTRSSRRRESSATGCLALQVPGAAVRPRRPDRSRGTPSRSTQRSPFLGGPVAGSRAGRVSGAR